MDKEKLQESLCGNYDYILRLLRVMDVDENDVEDLAEDVFVAAFKSIDSLKDNERMKPWLKAIATNKARKYFGSRKKRRETSNMIRMEAGELDIFDVIADEITVEHILQEAEEKALVETLIDSLSDVGRKIIRMRFWGEYKFREIADNMGLNINTVKTVYRRSLKQLEANYHNFSRKEEGNG